MNSVTFSSNPAGNIFEMFYQYKNIFYLAFLQFQSTSSFHLNPNQSKLCAHEDFSSLSTNPALTSVSLKSDACKQLE